MIRQVNLSDISTSIQTGPFGSQLHQSDYSDEGIPVIMPKDILNGSISDFSIARVEDNTVDKLSRYKVNLSDIIYPRRGDIAKCAIIQPHQVDWLCGTGCLKVSIDRTKAYPLFVYYQLQLPHKTGWLEKHAVGATMLNLNTSILGNVPIDLPELPIQKRIASILSHYDAQIKNNQKQINLLEEAAQRIYKEWFVDFRFPGHENVKIVDGIPEGWKKKCIGDCLLTHFNGGWGKEDNVGSYSFAGRVIRGTDIEKLRNGDFGEIPLRYHTEHDITNKKIMANDIIIELSNGNINNVGRTLFLDNSILSQYKEKVICASFCKLLRPLNRFYALILYCEMQDLQNSNRMFKYKKNGANGINNFDFKGLLKHEIILPNNKEIAEPLSKLLEVISNKRVQIDLLTEARDRLLPKLMSGEIEV